MTDVLPPICPKCNDRGMVYQEGSYGWDYGGYSFCDCAVGVVSEKAMYDAYTEESPDAK